MHGRVQGRVQDRVQDRVHGMGMGTACVWRGPDVGMACVWCDMACMVRHGVCVVAYVWRGRGVGAACACRREDLQPAREHEPAAATWCALAP